MKPFDFAAQLHLPELPTYLMQVETGLSQVVSAAGPSLRPPLARLLAVRGKRLRPTLTLAVAAAHKAPIDERLIGICVAVELAHLGSLVHDDIIDDSPSRWSIPTVNKQEGVRQAILAGDYLLAAACRQAALVNTELAQLVAVTIATMCEGEAAELTTQYDIKRSTAHILQTMHDKTAVLLAAACQAGALYAGATMAEQTVYYRYGEAFGMAFQLVDDVLDVVSAPELSGKPVGSDVQAGMYTLPVRLVLDGPQAVTLTTLLGQKAEAPVADILSVLLQTDALPQSLARAGEYGQIASQALGRLTANDAVAGLRTLPQAYTAWAIQQLVLPAYRSHLAQP